MSENTKEIKVTFKTLTPLWTGNAWRDNEEIRSSSIIGTLRFWFEVICYFAGVTNEKNYERGKLNDNLELKEFREKLLGNLRNEVHFKGLDRILAKCNISLPSRVFGCTGWKGWIRIKKIEFEKDNLKNILKGRIINSKNWFWGTPYYDGQFTITFEAEKEVLEPILYPLLTFIEKYGFLGGKWNIGYGRVKIEEIDEKKDKNWQVINNEQKEEFGFSQFYKNKDVKYLDKNFSDFINIDPSLTFNSNSFDFIKYLLNVGSFYCNSERDFKRKINNIPNEVRVTRLSNQNQNSDIKHIIKELLKKKAKIRNCLRHKKERICFNSKGDFLREKEFSENSKCKEIEEELFCWRNFRYQLLGTTAGGLEGTKIIPWIYEENGQLKGGFISIAGILKLEGVIK